MKTLRSQNSRGVIILTLYPRQTPHFTILRTLRRRADMWLCVSGIVLGYMVSYWKLNWLTKRMIIFWCGYPPPTFNKGTGSFPDLPPFCALTPFPPWSASLFLSPPSLDLQGKKAALL